MRVVFSILILLHAHWISGMDVAKEKGAAAAQSATEKGKGVFAQEGSGFKSFSSVGITVNPNYQQSTNPQELKSQANSTFHNDKAAQMIHSSHKTREMRTIDLDNLQLDADGFLKDMGQGGIDPDESFEIKTCRTPGDTTYTSTCKRQRIVEIEVIPEVWSSQDHCPGHAKKERKGWSCHYSHWTEYCGGCEKRQVKTREKQLNPLRDEWVGCEAEDKSHEEGLCELIKETPGPYNQTRMFNNEPVQKDYWETTRVYRCGARAEGSEGNSCEALKAMGCIHIEGKCIREHITQDQKRICLEYEHKYKCLVTTSYSQRGIKGLPKGYCMKGDCVKTSRSSNKNMFDALSKLETLKQIGKELNINDPKIFTGKGLGCTTNFGGSFKDCCGGMNGFGLSMKLTPDCDADEKTLAEARKNKLCVFIGSYKKNDHLGINFSKRYTYCCFPTKLSRIFHEQARRQLGISWGDAKNPDCRGLSFQELQRVDMTKINFSEIFSDIAQDVTKSTAHVRQWAKGAQKAFSQSDASQIQKEKQENLLRQTQDRSGKQSQTQNQGGSDNEISY